jgi:hypothetical protein
MALITSVVRVQQIFIVRIEQELRPLGLSLARYEVLMLLLFSRKGELPLGKIGARLQVQPGAITNAIDRLETDRMVVRRPHASRTDDDCEDHSRRDATAPETAVAVLNERVRALDIPAERVDELFGLLKIIRCRAGDFPSETV